MVPHARAEDRIIVTEPTDYWFNYAEETVFTATTYQSGDLPSDPQLWLYSGEELIYTNDDTFGLQSHIEIVLAPGAYRLRAGTCCYQPDVWRDGIEWNVQYKLYYTGIQVDPPTTTEPETTTTTIQETTTTTWEPTTTSTEPTTTSTTTAPTTSVPVEEVPTTVETTTTSSSTTTTTTIGSTTVLATVPPTTTLPPTTTTSTTTTSLAPTTTATTSTPPTVPPTSSTLPPNEIPPSPSADEIVTYLETITPEDLATLDSEQITELVDDIANAELTDEQAEQIAQALTNAPAEVKQAFQEAVNVFGGQFDSYVPTGSTVPVGTRRTLIAVTTATFAASTPISRKKTK